MPKSHRHAWTRRALFVLMTSGLAFLGHPTRARADRISIRGGGQIRGKLVPDKEHPGHLLFIGEVGKAPMSFTKDQILRVTPEPGPLDEYVVRLARDRPTPESEYQLGLWCEANRLPDLAQLHYERTVKRDSGFAEAHKKLGHVEMGGRWLNADELKEAQGMVKYKGHWVTPEEKERRDLLAATAAESNSWVKRIRAYREAFLSGPPERSREAENRLLAIEEPLAVGPILKVLGDDPIPVLRSLAARVLGVIPGPESTRGLVGRLLGEEDEAVRQDTMNVVARRDPMEMVPLLSRGLKSAHHEIINRAAWALGNLNASIAVPRLVPVLVTFEYEVMMVDSGAGTPGIGFNSTAPGFANYTGRSIPVLTGPAVAPGAVAYGATSVPYATSGNSIGGGGGSPRGPTPRVVQIEHHNGEVLAALIKLTGCDFGYDIATWNRWVATSFKVNEKPSRRVPEP